MFRLCLSHLQGLLLFPWAQRAATSSYPFTCNKCKQHSPVTQGIQDTTPNRLWHKNNIQMAVTRWRTTRALNYETLVRNLNQHGPKRTPQDRRIYFPHRTKLHLLRHRSPASLHGNITTSKPNLKLHQCV
jgi:hypothetical protein